MVSANHKLLRDVIVVANHLRLCIVCNTYVNHIKLSQAELVELEKKITQITAEKETALQSATEDITMLNEKLARANDEINQYKAQLAEYIGIKVPLKQEHSFERTSDLNLKSVQTDDINTREKPNTGELESEPITTVRFVCMYCTICTVLLYICSSRLRWIFIVWSEYYQTVW